MSTTFLLCAIIVLQFLILFGQQKNYQDDYINRINEELKKPAELRTSAGFKNAYKQELNEENNS